MRGKCTQKQQQIEETSILRKSIKESGKVFSRFSSFPGATLSLQDTLFLHLVLIMLFALVLHLARILIQICHTRKTHKIKKKKLKILRLGKLFRTPQHSQDELNQISKVIQTILLLCTIFKKIGNFYLHLD